MKSFALTLLLLLCCSACSTVKVQQTVEAGHQAEAVQYTADTGCSYFYFLWGKSAELKGPAYYAEAAEAYDKALVCDERATYVMQSLAILLLQMDKRQQAIAKLEGLLELQPDDLHVVSLLANVYAASGHLDKAVELYRRFLERQPDNQQALLLLGTFYARHKRYAEAQEILETLLKLNNKSPDGHLYLARLYRELKMYDRAISQYEKSLELRWSTVLAMEAADLMEAQGQYEKAAALYRRLLAEDETNEHARVQLAEIYLRQGEVDKALVTLKELKDYSSDVEQVDLTIGRILMEQKRYAEAEAQFRRMLDVDPDSEAARTLLAMVYYETGREQQAVDTLKVIGPDSENYADVVAMMARMLVDMGNFDQAESLLTEAIERGTEPLSRLYILLASLYQKKGETEEARKIYKQALGQFPNDHQLYFEYGMFLDKTGEHDQAMKIMEKVLELNPDDPYALNYIAYTWVERGINLDKAQKYLLDAVGQLPDDGFVRDSLGWLYFRQGAYKKAVQELEKAHELEKEDPTILEHLADAYGKVGKVSAAAECYKKAMELYQEEDRKEAVRQKLHALPVEPRKDAP